MRIKPLRGRVIVNTKIIEGSGPAAHQGDGKWTPDGKLFRPQVAEEMPLWVQVMGVGEPMLTRKGAPIPMCFTVGDLVLVPWAKGVETTIGGVTTRTIWQDEVMAMEVGR